MFYISLNFPPLSDRSWLEVLKILMEGSRGAGKSGLKRYLCLKCFLCCGYPVSCGDLNPRPDGSMEKRLLYISSKEKYPEPLSSDSMPSMYAQNLCKIKDPNSPRHMLARNATVDHKNSQGFQNSASSITAYLDRTEEL